MLEEKQLNAITQIKKFHSISHSEVKKLNEFVELLIKSNQEYNLIGKSTIDDIWNRHILDSAQLLKYIGEGSPYLGGMSSCDSTTMGVHKNQIIGDFGSGAGLPAIVLSILGIKEIHLIEKSFRKCEFLNLAAKISSNKIVVHQKKVEEIKDVKFDILTSRAFAPLDKLIPIVKPFLKRDSYGIFLKGKNFESEINLAKKNNKFHHEAYSSLTSEEGKILLIKNII